MADRESLIAAISQAMGERRHQINAAAGYHFPLDKAVRLARADAEVAADAVLGLLELVSPTRGASDG